MLENSLCIFGEVLYDVFPDGQQVLGAAGVLVASAVVKAKDPAKAIQELLGGI